VYETTFVYSIDADDAIASVSDPWLQFARVNGASELTRDYVVGQTLWRFIAGLETRRLYEELFSRVRTLHKSIEIPFRCDSPNRFRFMRLVLDSASGDSIRCEGILIRAQERPFFSILDRAFPRSRGTLPICSLCKRILVSEERWLDVQDAIRDLDLFESASLPELDYVVCDACRSLSRQA
jgi:hypothetical protein